MWCVGEGKIEEFEKHLGELSNVHTSKAKGRCIKYVTGDIALFKLCEQCGRHSHTKIIPSILLNLPSHQLQFVVEGYLSGDGSAVAGLRKANSVSKCLIYQMAQCIEKVYDVPVNVYFTKTTDTCIIEGRLVNQRDIWTLTFRGSDARVRYIRMNDNWWAPVRQIKHDVDREELVYNMEVEDVHSYTANRLAAHNCQDFSLAGERRGLNGDRSVLVREIFRLLDSIAEKDRPEWLIYENVEGMLYSNRGWDYFSILSEMDKFGYDIEWQIINTNSVICQSRPRVYTIGHLRARGTKQVFPIEKAHFKNDYGREKILIYSDKVEEDTIYLTDNKFKDNLFNFKPESKLSFPIFVDLSVGNVLDCKRESNCLDTKCSKGVSDFGACASGVLLNEDTPREDSIKLNINGETCSIRKLTALECWRLQGWSDDYYEKASQVTFESQLYKQAGNGVTVRIIELLGEKLKELE